MKILKKIFNIILYILFALIVTTIIVGLVGYAIRLFLNGYGNNIAFNGNSDYTAISLQFTFFGIILTLFALGGAVLAFIGWREMKGIINTIATNETKKIVKEEANNFYKNHFSKLIEGTVLDVMGKITVEKSFIKDNNSSTDNRTKELYKKDDNMI